MRLLYVSKTRTLFKFDRRRGPGGRRRRPTRRGVRGLKQQKAVRSTNREGKRVE